MADPRVSDYARLIVERSIDAQPGWQVVIVANPPGRPLLEEVVRLIGRRGAYAIVQLSYGAEDFWPLEMTWAEEAPLGTIAERPPLRVAIEDSTDAWIRIGAPENTREGAELEAERRTALAQAARPLVARRLALEIPWVTCRFPTNALAQDADMSLPAFEDFLYGTVLLDWDALGREMQRVADRFDAAEEVRIVGDGTDLRFSIAAARARSTTAT